METVEDMSEIAAKEAGDKSQRTATADDTRPNKRRKLLQSHKSTRDLQEKNLVK